MNRLKEKYLNKVVPSLMSKYNYKSVMEAPKLEKIVIINLFSRQKIHSLTHQIANT